MKQIEFIGFGAVRAVDGADIPSDTWFVNMEQGKPVLYYKSGGAIIRMSNCLHNTELYEDTVFCGFIDIDVKISVTPKTNTV